MLAAVTSSLGSATAFTTAGAPTVARTSLPALRQGIKLIHDLVIEWYNTERGHTSLDNEQTPDKAYWRLLPEQKIAA